MTSKRNVLLTLLILAAVALLEVTGGPVITFNFETSSGGEPSGEELETEKADILQTLIHQHTNKHKEQFEEEFKNVLNYTFLEYYKCPSPQVTNCTSKRESCLLKFLRGLLKYKVLLKYVETQYPTNSILLAAKNHFIPVINQIKQLMKHPELVEDMAATEDQAPQCGDNNTNEFQRKMTAHSILRSFNHFLIDGYRALTNIKKNNINSFVWTNKYLNRAINQL